jgi:hypothetical protein
LALQPVLRNEALCETGHYSVFITVFSQYKANLLSHFQNLPDPKIAADQIRYLNSIESRIELIHITSLSLTLIAPPGCATRYCPSTGLADERAVSLKMGIQLKNPAATARAG